MRFSFCPLFSGSSGNCLLACAGDTRVLIDAGMTGRAILGELCKLGVSPDTLCGILVTHEHSDHIRSVGMLSRKFDLPVYASEGTWCAMEEKVQGVAPKNQRVFAAGQDFFVGSLGVQPFSIPHDAADPVGFSLLHGGGKIAVATDLGHLSPSWMQAVSGAQVLMLESNHDLDMLARGPYPARLKQRIRGRKGHLSNEDCAKALTELVPTGLRSVILGHLSGENNLPELAYQAAWQAISALGAVVGEDVTLEVARRDQMSSLFTVA